MQGRWRGREKAMSPSSMALHTRTQLLKAGSGLELPPFCAKSLQSSPILRDPMDCSLPGSSVHGISQARILEKFATSFSRGSSQLRDQTHVSCVSCVGRQILYHPFSCLKGLDSSLLHGITSWGCTSPGRGH